MKKIELAVKAGKTDKNVGTLAWTTAKLQGLNLQFGRTTDGCLSLENIREDGTVETRICQENRSDRMLPHIRCECGSYSAYDEILYETQGSLKCWRTDRWEWGVAICYAQESLSFPGAHALFGRVLTPASARLVSQFLRACAELLAAKIRERDALESAEVEGLSVSVKIDTPAPAPAQEV
jgi:hypothetical protein